MQSAQLDWLSQIEYFLSWLHEATMNGRQSLGRGAIDVMASAAKTVINTAWMPRNH